MGPVIFISTVSKEFASTRQRVANILTRLGYDAVWQDIFGTEPGDLRQVLRDKIDKCDGLIQIVGHAYGAEPPAADPDYGRVSYTQFEFRYAQTRKKKTWLIFAGDDCTRDEPLDQIDLPPHPHHPDPLGWQAERRQLQENYRQKLMASGHLCHEPATDSQLDLTVERLRGKFADLRGQFRSWQRKVVRLGKLAIVLIICGLVLMAYLIIRSQPPDEGGPFTIAVAGLTEMGPFEESGIGNTLAEGVYDLLKREFRRKEDEPLYPSILPPTDVGPVAGSNFEEVNQSAREAANECNAHLFVYGIVREPNSSQWEISPQFWVALDNVHELEGQHKFGEPFTVPQKDKGFTALDMVGSQISRRTALLANIAAGLMHYADSTPLGYERALEYFQSIDTDKAWAGIQGKELLYVLLGNTAGRLRRLDTAERYFRNALELDNEYPRARLGLADIYIIRAAEEGMRKEDCDRLLGEALENYRMVEKNENQSSDPYVTTKLNYGLGKYYCLRGLLSSKRADLDQAISRLQAVVDTYESTQDEKIKELASVAKGLIDDIRAHLERREPARDEDEHAPYLTNDRTKESPYDERTGNLQN